MEAIAASPIIKGKQPAYMPVTMTQGPSSYSSASSGSPSDNDEDAYFSDVSTSSSVTSSTSSSLGDFVFENDEEYADYFEIVKATIQAKAAERSSSPQYSFSSAKSSVQTSSSSATSSSKKSKSSYRKSTSSFFLSGSSFPSSLPRIPTTLAAQNPSLNKAAQNLSSRISKLNSYFPREDQVSESDSEDDAEPACERCQEDNVDERFERALMFAEWSKRGRAGVWEGPQDASNGLKKLVALAQ